MIVRRKAYGVFEVDFIEMGRLRQEQIVLVDAHYAGMWKDGKLPDHLFPPYRVIVRPLGTPLVRCTASWANDNTYQYVELVTGARARLLELAQTAVAMARPQFKLPQNKNKRVLTFPFAQVEYAARADDNIAISA